MQRRIDSLMSMDLKNRGQIASDASKTAHNTHMLAESTDERSRYDLELNAANDEVQFLKEEVTSAHSDAVHSVHA